MKLTPMKFDFTNFAARVAELNRLHKLVHESSRLRLRTGKAEDIERWEKAVKDWKEFSGFGYPETKFYFFENQTFLAALSAGDAEAKESAICSKKISKFPSSSFAASLSQAALHER